MQTLAVSVATASGSNFKVNKNGKLPLIFTALNGTLPTNAGVIDGSVAERLGIQSGGQYVIGVSFTGWYEANGKKYANYNYYVITKLGSEFEKLVSAQVVASMNFGFTPIAQAAPVEATSIPTPVEAEKTAA